MSPSEITLREMMPDDLLAVHELETAVQPDDPWSLTIFTDCLRVGYPAWVLYRDDELVGYSVLMFTEPDAHLLNLVIKPTMQGQGLAKRLVHAMMDFSQQQGCTRIYLEVRQSNARAIRLYEHLEFHRDGVRPDYYITSVGREDAFLYSRLLVVK